MLKQRGFTLIELMVAMAIGTVISLALSQIFATSSRVKAENDRLGLQIENGRFSLDMLQQELAHSAFWGAFDLSTARGYYRSWAGRPVTLPDPCETAVATLMDSVPFHVQGYNDVDGTNLPAGLGCIDDVKDMTDILVVRRAGTCPVGGANCEPNLVAGTAYFQASTCSPDDATELSTTLRTGNEWTDLKSNWFLVSDDPNALTLHGFLATNTIACKTDALAVRAPRRPLMTKIFYISNNTNTGDGIPALRMVQLQTTGGTVAFSTPQVLASGIELLHFEYGIDSSGDGTPDTFTPDPGSFGGCATTACMDNWLNVRAVRVHLLSRGLTQSPEYTDRRTYALGLDTAGAAVNYPPQNDHYRRQYFSETVRSLNASN